MSTTTKFPTTLSERLELGAGDIRMPARWEEYTELLAECEYQIEYEDQHIIIRSVPTHPHEAIVMNIGGLLFQIFKKHPDMLALGSNRHVFIEEFRADYAPDVSVLKGKPVEYELRKGLTAYTNPHIIFEVLSPSTSRKDWTTKLPRYKKLGSVRQIIYIEQRYPYIYVFDRIGDSGRWENADYDRLDQSFPIEGEMVSLSDLYQKVIFEEEG